MSELIPIFIVSMLLALLSEYFTVRNSQNGLVEKEDHLWWLIMAAAMILFVGLRTRYNDTLTYLGNYRALLSEPTPLSDISWQLGDNPGYQLSNNIMAMFGISDQTFILIYAVATVGIYVWFIRKYSCNFVFSIFLLFVTGAYTFTLAAIKQCVAVAFALIATHYAIKKRWILFVLWILIASTFHPYALMYGIVPVMMFRPWTGKTYLSLVAFGCAGFALQSLMGVIVDVTTMLGEEFDAASFAGEGVNPFRLAVCAVPLILSFITRNVRLDSDSKEIYLMVNLAIINAEIMFVALFGTANYFARLANYFIIMQSLSIPWLLKKFEKRSEQFLTVVAVICYLAYFYYANAIDQPFDLYYSRITIFEYLKSLI